MNCRRCRLRSTGPRNVYNVLRSARPKLLCTPNIILVDENIASRTTVIRVTPRECVLLKTRVVINPKCNYVYVFFPRGLLKRKIRNFVHKSRFFSPTRVRDSPNHSGLLDDLKLTLVENRLILVIFLGKIKVACVYSKYMTWLRVSANTGYKLLKLFSLFFYGLFIYLKAIYNLYKKISICKEKISKLQNIAILNTSFISFVCMIFFPTYSTSNLMLDISS